MAASYPSSVKTFPTINDGDTVQPSDPTAAYDEIAAIEAALLTGGLDHDLTLNDGKDLTVGGDASVTGALAVTGDTTLTGDLTVSGTLTAPLAPSAGIAFPATQAASADANTLDDYEEGSWTPVLGGVSGTTGQTYAVQTGGYVKVGQLVVASFNLQFSERGTITGNLQLSGLPVATGAGPSTVIAVAASSLAVSVVAIFIECAAEGTTGLLYKTAAADSTMFTAMTDADLSDSTILRGVLTYRAGA